MEEEKESERESKSMRGGQEGLLTCLFSFLP